MKYARLLFVTLLMCAILEVPPPIEKTPEPIPFRYFFDHNAYPWYSFLDQKTGTWRKDFNQSFTEADIVK